MKIILVVLQVVVLAHLAVGVLHAWVVVGLVVLQDVVRQHNMLHQVAKVAVRELVRVAALCAMDLLSKANGSNKRKE